MTDVKPFRYGDTLTIRHAGGREQAVIYCGVFGNKFDQAYVEWPLAGEYKIKLDTGQLLPKKVSLWRVVDHDLKRLRATSAKERNDTNERMKSSRFGTRR